MGSDDRHSIFIEGPHAQRRAAGVMPSGWTQLVLDVLWLSQLGSRFHRLIQSVMSTMASPTSFSAMSSQKAMPRPDRPSLCRSWRSHAAMGRRMQGGPDVRSCSSGRII
jgi:hypothetical protein